MIQGLDIMNPESDEIRDIADDMRKQAEALSRRELEDTFVEMSVTYYKLSMKRAEIRGETVNEMQRLLHNARTNYTFTLSFSKGPQVDMISDGHLFLIAMNAQEMQTAINEISAVLEAVE